VQLVFRKKTRGQVIGAEFQEGLAHIGIAATEAGRLAAEQLGPRVDAAKVAVAPKVAAAVAAATPAVEAAREAITPRVEAAREAAAPRVAAAVAAAHKAAAELGPRVEAAREAATPRVEAALEAAQKALKDDVVPRLEAAQVAALAYATPKVVSARQAVTPALDSARETLVAGVESARSEIDARRAELVASAERSTRKARKKAKKARKAAGQARREFEKKAAATAKQVRRRTGAEPEPRRWPWVFLAFALGTAAFVLLRRRKDDSWTPAPVGDGPVPSYREDPVPSSPSDSGKTVSTAMDTPSDSAPAESDMGVRDAQLVEGDGPDTETVNGTDAPEPFSSGGGSDQGPTAGPADKQV
jgi:hypothetical protein